MKPAWLDKKISLHACSEMKEFLRGAHVNTVCEQAMCPNIGECFDNKQATFLILGNRCTRACSFCNIEKGIPAGIDPREPRRVAEAVKRLGLRHVVVTSVTRDDLADGGAEHFAQTVAQIRILASPVTIEVLIPDLNGSSQALSVVVDAHPDIIAHNVETVPSLYMVVRQGSAYTRSLEILRQTKMMSGVTKIKSGIMVGLGEKAEEVIQVMKDLRGAGCEYLSIGQYLAPSRSHYPVKEFIHPEQFIRYKEAGTGMGFAHIESGPYVRSSYMAHRYTSGEDVRRI